MRSMLPALTNQYLHLIRNTSLGAAIAFPEVTHVMAGTVLNQTGQAFETIGLTMGVYLGISILASLLIERFNRHLITQGARRTGT
jgi:general L-amino acid transport system permease protein